MTPDIRQLLKQGHANLAKRKSEIEAAVAGHPRVGSVGAVMEDGKIYGTCHRKALVRALGIDELPEEPTRIMWDAGEACEDTWIKVLTAANSGLALLRHDELAIKHQLDGVDLAVLGHPDIILARVDRVAVDTEYEEPYEADAYSPVLGIEHKGVFGYSTAALVWFENRPKNDNLIQAAAYSYFLKLSYELWYTSASYYSISIYDKKKYGTGSIKPFYKGFKLEWRDDTLWYKPEELDWVKTPVTFKGIEDYYRLIQEMPIRKELGPRPTSDYLDGKENRWGKLSDCKFCVFAPACDKYDQNKNYDEWLQQIKESL